MQGSWGVLLSEVAMCSHCLEQCHLTAGFDKLFQTCHICPVIWPCLHCYCLLIFFFGGGGGGGGHVSPPPPPKLPLIYSLDHCLKRSKATWGTMDPTASNCLSNLKASDHLWATYFPQNTRSPMEPPRSQNGAYWIASSHLGRCVPSDSLGLHLQPHLFQTAIRWWLGISHIASPEGNSLVCLDKSNSRPADIDGSASAAFDISVTSPLNSSLVVEAGTSSGVAARAAEKRKHLQNDAKCKQLGWRCIPLVVKTYGAWGAEAIEVFSTLASRLAVGTLSTKPRALATLYGRLSMILVWANAGAIVMRSYLPSSAYNDIILDL